MQSELVLYPNWIYTCILSLLSKTGLAVMVIVVSLLGGLILTFFSLAFHHLFAFEEEKIFTNAATFAVFYFRTGLCVCWSLLYFGIKLMRESTNRELRLAREQADRREAELQMLRAQINPHFLFNALNTILFALEKQKEGVARMVQALSDYLNYSLLHRNDDFVTLGEECDALMDYLALEKARFGETLNMACQIDPETRTTRSPAFSSSRWLRMPSNLHAKLPFHPSLCASTSPVRTMKKFPGSDCGICWHPATMSKSSEKRTRLPMLRHCAPTFGPT